MEDGLALNIDFQTNDTDLKPHLGWRERKKQTRERQAKKRQRFGTNQHARPVAVIATPRPFAGSGAAAAAGGTAQGIQQDQTSQALRALHQAAKNGRDNASARAPAQQRNGSKRPAHDALHGYGDVLAKTEEPSAQQQQQKHKPNTTPTAAEAVSKPATAGRAAKRPNIAETAAAATAAAESMTAAEQSDIMALVQLNMTIDQLLEQEQEEQQQQRKRRKGMQHTEQATPGVVEFGDAPDEPDAHTLLLKATQHKGSSHSSSKKATAASKQQEQQQKPQQQLAQHKAGEMVHAEPNVPAEQRQQLFGDAAAAGDGSWSGLGLCESLANHLVALNFQEPTQVQQRAIPVLLSGRDALVRSPTGSGKTLAYLAPLIQQLQAAQPRISRTDGTHAVVLVPTRELAVQVSDVLTALVRRFVWLVAGMLIGGEHRGHEKARLRKGVTILVATPGRLLDHLQNTTSFKTENLNWLILDEADRLLDLGFEAKLKSIVEAFDSAAAAAADNSYSAEAQRKRQTVLLSATLHPGLSTLAGLSMRNPVGVGFEAKVVDGQLQLTDASSAAADGSEEVTQQDGIAAAGGQGQGKFELPQQLQQKFVEVPAKMRLVALIGVLRSRLRRSREAKMVVFLSNCDSVDFHHQLLHHHQQHTDDEAGSAAEQLLLGSCPVLKLHGDMKQPERTSSLVTFSKAKSCVLLCTDVAARGLDFPAVSTIIQYDPAGDPAEYVHRVGRTARMGQKGEALLFLMPSEVQYAQLLNQQGIKLTQEPLDSLLQCLPGLAGRQGSSAAAVQQMAMKMRKFGASKGNSSAHQGGSGFDGVEGLDDVKPEVAAAAIILQRQLVALVSRDEELSRMATKAFRSFVRAYTTHPAALKHVFYVRGLHLGHVAACFGLREAPSKIGASGAVAERKKRKLEEKQAVLRREKKAWHKNAKAAAALGQ